MAVVCCFCDISGPGDTNKSKLLGENKTDQYGKREKKITQEHNHFVRTGWGCPISMLTSAAINAVHRCVCQNLVLTVTVLGMKHGSLNVVLT